MSRTCSPDDALACTGTVAWSSSAWPTGRLPILQVVPVTTGQTVNFGLPTYGADAVAAVTETPLVAATVLHTQITKLALWPAVILDELENDCTRTHS